jgi:hypothetical protein
VVIEVSNKPTVTNAIIDALEPDAFTPWLVLAHHSTCIEVFHPSPTYTVLGPSSNTGKMPTNTQGCERFHASSDCTKSMEITPADVYDYQFVLRC